MNRIILDNCLKKHKEEEKMVMNEKERLEVELEVFENVKSLKWIELVEFLKYLNKRFLKIKEFNPKEFVQSIDKNKVIFRIKNEKEKEFLKLLKERYMIREL